MNHEEGVGLHNEAAARLSSLRRNGCFKFGGIMDRGVDQGDRVRTCCGLQRWQEKSRKRSRLRIVDERSPLDARHSLLQQAQPFAAYLRFEIGIPCDVT